MARLVSNNHGRLLGRQRSLGTCVGVGPALSGDNRRKRLAFRLRRTSRTCARALSTCSRSGTRSCPGSFLYRMGPGKPWEVPRSSSGSRKECRALRRSGILESVPCLSSMQGGAPRESGVVASGSDQTSRTAGWYGDDGCDSS